jgi:hypothetical protein
VMGMAGAAVWASKIRHTPNHLHTTNPKNHNLSPGLTNI